MVDAGASSQVVLAPPRVRLRRRCRYDYEFALHTGHILFLDLERVCFLCLQPVSKAILGDV